MSLSDGLSISLPLSLPVSLFSSPILSLFLCVSLRDCSFHSLPVSLCLSLSIYLLIYLSIYLSISYRLSVSVSLYISLSVFISMFPCLSLSMVTSVRMTVGLFVIYLSHLLPPSTCLCIYLFTNLWLCYLQQHKYLYLPIYLSIYLPISFLISDLCSLLCFLLFPIPFQKCALNETACLCCFNSPVPCVHTLYHSAHILILLCHFAGAGRTTGE